MPTNQLSLNREAEKLKANLKLYIEYSLTKSFEHQLIYEHLQHAVTEHTLNITLMPQNKVNACRFHSQEPRVIVCAWTLLEMGNDWADIVIK